ncbi:MAG TPA: hypothetical protein VF407_25305 [Polyangiaceae bacterium]
MKSIALLSVASLVALSAFATGCTITSTSSGSSGSSSSTQQQPLHSSTVDVAQMRASMSAQASDTTVKIYASLFADDGSTGNRGVVLDTGDYFTAQIGNGEPVVLTMEPLESSDIVHYTATLPAPADAADVTIALVRPAGKIGAPSSVVHLPAPFRFTTTPPVSVHAGDTLEVGLDPAPDGYVEIEASGACVDADSSTNDWFQATNADGSVDVHTSLAFVSGKSAGCDVSFYVSSIDEGTLDPAFAGGISGIFDVEGIQKRGFDVSVLR